MHHCRVLSSACLTSASSRSFKAAIFQQTKPASTLTNIHPSGVPPRHHLLTPALLNFAHIHTTFPRHIATMSSSNGGAQVAHKQYSLHDMTQGDGREQRLLAHVQQTAQQGNPQAVLAAIDSFAWGSEWLMNVGDVKGHILDAEVQAAVAKGATTFVELGAYCGYSSVRIASQLPPGAVLYSMEVNPDWAKVAQSVLQHAGLGDRAKLLVGDVEQGVQALQGRGIQSVDFLFIDHWKGLYVRDFLLMRQQGMLRKGAVVVADNLLIPGAPDYVDLMEQHPQDFAFTKHYTKLEYSEHQDMVGVAVMLR